MCFPWLGWWWPRRSPSKNKKTYQVHVSGLFHKRKNKTASPNNQKRMCCKTMIFISGGFHLLVISFENGQISCTIGSTILFFLSSTKITTNCTRLLKVLQCYMYVTIALYCSTNIFWRIVPGIPIKHVSNLYFIFIMTMKCKNRYSGSLKERVVLFEGALVSLLEADKRSV